MYIIITSSPNKDGLTAACGKAAYDGITGAGGEAEIIDISELKLQPCRIAQERIGITRFNRVPALSVIEDAGARLVRGEYFTRLCISS